MSRLPMLEIRTGDALALLRTLPADSIHAGITPTERNIMNLEPIANRIIIRPAAEAETSRGGIILPDAAKEKPQAGEVLAVGPGRRTEAGALIPMTLAGGDQVLYSRCTGTPIKHEGEELVILDADEILARVR